MFSANPGDDWLVHPGRALSVADMFQSSVKEEPATNNGKRKNPGMIVAMEPMPECEQRDKLYAVANFRAEVLRAKREGQEVVPHIAHALFEKDYSNVGRIPKQFFVLWSAKTPELRLEHATEVLLSSLCNLRNL